MHKRTMLMAAVAAGWVYGVTGCGDQKDSPGAEHGPGTNELIAPPTTTGTGASGAMGGGGADQPATTGSIHGRQ